MAYLCTLSINDTQQYNECSVIVLSFALLGLGIKPNRLKAENSAQITLVYL
jgi:hypothetical protein